MKKIVVTIEVDGNVTDTLESVSFLDDESDVAELVDEICKKMGNTLCTVRMSEEEKQVPGKAGEKGGGA